jgi:ATP/maltotriose-dependent transcriptional regulator MalT
VQGQPHAAQRLYAEAVARAEAANLPALTVTPLVRLARLHFQRHALAEAAACLALAFERAPHDGPPLLAEPLGDLHLFADDGPMLADLLAKFPTDHPAHAYAARLLALLPAPALPAVELAEPLNPHELEILRLLARGLSNSDIARERVLAVSTVRWYLKHIYQKLNVHNRTQAAERARTLKLL